MSRGTNLEAALAKAWEECADSQGPCSMFKTPSGEYWHRPYLDGDEFFTLFVGYAHIDALGRYYAIQGPPLSARQREEFVTLLDDHAPFLKTVEAKTTGECNE